MQTIRNGHTEQKTTSLKPNNNIKFNILKNTAKSVKRQLERIRISKHSRHIAKKNPRLREIWNRNNVVFDFHE